MTQGALLLRDMIRIRRVEEVLADLYRDEQEMRTPTHFSIGQEATAVGACAPLRRTDLVYSGHRCHAHYLAKGGDLFRMVAELYGRETGCAGGRGGSMHLTDPDAGFAMATPILGETIAVAVGAGWAISRSGAPHVSVCFFGDGATEEGVFHESLNFAALHRVPTLFVCENNGYSITSPLHARQPAGTTIWQRALGYGILARHVDGNDVFAVRDAAAEAVRFCRTGNGPYLLELDTYRWREHVGPGWDRGEGYRTESEVDSWLDRCPIRLATAVLRAEDDSIDGQVARWDEEFRTEACRAADAARASAFPSVEQLIDGTYEGYGAAGCAG
jgi:TPP-dependent pyruvate/acetoin dehydrogenase alpha subunit